MISIIIRSVPIAQPRPRAFNAGGSARIVSAPSKHPVNDFKAAIKHEIGLLNPSPLTGPVTVHLYFVMPRPKALFWKSRPMPRIPHAKKPDVDNLAKSVLDACNELLWRDDSQICELKIEKCIASGCESPYTLIRFGEWVE